MTSDNWLVYLAGTPWHGVAGTDRQLVTRLSRDVPVLWVDPPESILRWLRTGSGRELPGPGLTAVHPNVHRLRLPAPPGVTRHLVRDVVAAATPVAVHQALRRLGGSASSSISANPEARLSGLPGLKALYVTDDWIAGATMMGLDANRVKSTLRKNLASTDLLCGVSPVVIDAVRTAGPWSSSMRSLVLPNGCPEFPEHVPSTPLGLPKGPFAVLVGQLNERIDVVSLHRVVDSGVDLVIVGPRTERSPSTTAQLDELFSRPQVSWFGRRPQNELAGFLTAASVGLTPYVVNTFNDASFPLKSLEYLAAGLPVVSSDVAASRWIGSDLISIASGPSEFAALTAGWARSRPNPLLRARRRELAHRHSWDVRARSLLTELGRDVSPVENSRLSATS